MQKNILDYLFLLIGQEVIFEKCDPYLVRQKNIRKKEKHVLAGWMVDHILNKKDKVIIKPLLRPLADMTEAEEDEVARICFGSDDFTITTRQMGYSDGIFGKTNIHNSVRCIVLEQYVSHPLVTDTVPAAMVQIDYTDLVLPVILARFTKNGKMLEDDQIEDIFELSRFLVKAGFDVHGLIPAGLAFDKTTLK